LKEDAETFESWGVDYVKLDGCYSHPNDMDKGYPTIPALSIPAICGETLTTFRIHGTRWRGQ